MMRDDNRAQESRAQDNRAHDAARALATIGALAGSGPLTKIGSQVDPRPLARASDPETSHEAATRIASSISETQSLVLHFIRSRGASGCTDLDIQRRFGNHGSTYRTRRAELVALDLVRDSSVRVTQDRGRRIVWVAAEYAGERSTSSQPCRLLHPPLP